VLIHELTANECREELVRADFGRLACSHENQPYVVPIYFVFDDGDIYSFSMPGKKIEWMRANPLVCLEVEKVESATDWTSIVVFGRYDELKDLDDPRGRRHAHELLKRRVMWWEPGAAAMANRRDEANSPPIFFRIRIDSISGHRAVPAT
jgi:nitroimidazol reductase NimA-like FMN-containing flavoprotein (pyridoxamine 5'-phosphate oxidase superfamily)